MKDKIIIIIASLFIFDAGIYAVTGDRAGELPPQKRRINWENVEGAIEYRLQVADMNGRLIVDETAAESRYDIEVPYGKYRVRIGAINKFGKLDSWSEWAKITIAEEVKEPVFEFVRHEPLKIKIGLGPSFFYLLPDWDKLYENSLNSTTVNAAFSPLDFSYFKYAGIELEGTFLRLKSRSEEWRIETRMSAIFTGLNLFITTWFKFPVNMVFRLGGGIASTEQEYEKFDATNIYSRATAVLHSQDPFYKVGVSAEYRILENLYLEAGTDFYIVRYLTSDLSAIKFFVLIGTGL